jgi:signal transduction histidine kinase
MPLTGVYLLTLAFSSGISSLISLACLSFHNILKIEPLYKKCGFLSLIAALYYFLLVFYFSTTNANSAISIMLFIMGFLPYFTYFFAEVILEFKNKRTLFHKRIQKLNLVFCFLFSIASFADLIFKTNIITNWTIQTNTSSKAFHVFKLSNLALIYLSWVSTVFYIFAYELFMLYKKGNKELTHLIFGVFIYILSSTNDFFILWGMYDFYFLQHVGFLGIVIGFAELVFKRFAMTHTQLANSLENLQSAQEILIESEKHRVMGVMSAGIAHEINNPLGTASLYCEMMKDLIFQPNFEEKELFTTLKKFDNQIYRILKISDGLSSVQKRKNDDQMELEILDSLIRDQIVFCNHYIKSNGVALRIKNTRFFGKLLCRKTEVEQVISNLIQNAVDAVQKLPEKWIEVDTIHEPEYFAICITDSGNGIEPKLAERMFEPFFSTKPVGKGTGLGLSISAGIIESHGGTLKIDSSFQNTRFLIEFPIKLFQQ